MMHDVYMSDIWLDKRFICADLLEAPAPEVVRELITEIRRLRKSLNYISNPHSLLEDEAIRKGVPISTFSIEISTDVEFLKTIAIKTLQGEPLYV
jgi:hypothetical protein